MHSFLPRRLAAAALAAALSVTIPSHTQAQTQGRFPVVGYLPSWAGNLDEIPYEKLTHIMYSFAQTDGNGNITVANTQRLLDLLDRAHAKGAKVGLAVGGWNNGNTQPFEQMASNATSRANFVRQLVELCDEGIDGIDMDWEYPNLNSAANFATMMKELGEALHAKGKFLTAAVIAQGDWAGQHIRPSVFANVDFLNLMAYDATHIDHHASYELAVSSLDYWTKRGLPKHKAVLGVPFYGRSIRGGDRYVSYKDFVSGNPSLAQSDVHDGLYYNGIPTIQKKADLAYQKGGGIMIWELSQDAPGANSLLSAIAAKAATFPVLALRPRGAGSHAGRLTVTGPGLLRFRPATAGQRPARLLALDGSAAGAELVSRGAGEFRFDPTAVPAGAYLVEILGGSPAAIPLIIP